MHKFLIGGLASILVLALNAGDLLANEGGGGARRSAFANQDMVSSSLIPWFINMAEHAHLTGNEMTFEISGTRGIDGGFGRALLVLLYGDNERPQAPALQNQAPAPQSQTSAPSPGAAQGATPGSGSNILEPGAYPGLEASLHDLWSGAVGGPDGLTNGLQLHPLVAESGPVGLGS